MSAADEPAQTRTAAVLTIGTELVLGEIEDTNATWLCAALTRLGMTVQWAASVPDEIDVIVRGVRNARAAADVVIVSGGMGGTPDDVTRAGVARALGVSLRTDAALAEELRAAGSHESVFADEWSQIPDGASPLRGAARGAPGFRFENLYVLPGMPSEMRAMFERVEPQLRHGPALQTWSRTVAASEHLVLPCLEDIARHHGAVGCGAYPRRDSDGPEVKIVLRARSRDDLAAAARVIERFARVLENEA